MDRGAWETTVHKVAESDMTERLNHHQAQEEEELTGNSGIKRETGGFLTPELVDQETVSAAGSVLTKGSCDRMF